MAAVDIHAHTKADKGSGRKKNSETWERNAQTTFGDPGEGTRTAGRCKRKMDRNGLEIQMARVKPKERVGLTTALLGNARRKTPEGQHVKRT